MSKIDNMNRAITRLEKENVYMARDMLSLKRSLEALMPPVIDLTQDEDEGYESEPELTESPIPFKRPKALYVFETPPRK